MNTDPSCPVCDRHDWQPLGTRTYELAAAARLPEYVRARYDVLFSVWVPGAAEVRMASVLCRHCGFAAFTPRPSEADLDAKYRYLAQHELSRAEMNVSLASDAVRSEELAAAILTTARPEGRRLLDYGGGNGRLLGRFQALGFDCAVCDYVTETRPGVERLGSTLDEITPDRSFDLVICSHVLEHLAEPRRILARLVDLLAPGGLLYAEVPLEIWDGAPLPPEPVTHINFFAPHSFEALCDGLPVEVLECREHAYTNENGRRLPAVRLLIRRGAPGARWRSDRRAAASKTLAYVHPSVLGWLRRYGRYPDLRAVMRSAFVRRHLPQRFFWRFAS
jgi:SAM-dependent methyltransferase